MNLKTAALLIALFVASAASPACADQKAYEHLEEEFSYHRELLKARAKAGLT